MTDLVTADAVRAVREQLRIANKLKVADWLAQQAELMAFDVAQGYEVTSARIYRDAAKDLGVVL